MKKRPSLHCCALLLAATLAGVACDGSAKTPPLQRVHCLPIDHASDSICLFRDRQLDSAAVDSLWHTGQDSGHAPAEVRRISVDGTTLAVFVLNPLARLAQARISGQQFVLATEDLSVGAGSYNGPLTHVLDVSLPGKIKPAQDSQGYEILAISTLKAAWKLVPDGLLKASCGPNSEILDSIEFSRTYHRIRYRNGQWLRTERTEPGYTDFGDEEFPQDSLFPD